MKIVEMRVRDDSNYNKKKDDESFNIFIYDFYSSKSV